ncbi:glutathione synthase [Candidatus Marinamargulisbacteria bacterium SCGC AAA071-K20]|nr:glutathione synthase [Candidatus Marinamargulisbacteria bacterium SCGC AAA071-K20]
MKFVFLMDPLETVVYEKDTTFVLMKEAAHCGHHVYYLPKSGLHLSTEGLSFDLTEVKPTDDPSSPFEILSSITLKDTEIDVVFIRTDPPFDYGYLMHTWILDRCSPNVRVVNSPTGIRTVNEKVWATQFKNLVPPTLVSSSKVHINAFLETHQKIVVKPTDGFGGKDIHILELGGANVEEIVASMTKDGVESIISQAFVAESADGDKRILLLDGEPLGAVLRVHSKDDFRNNFFAGGTAEACDITPRDLEIIDVLKPHLKALGLFFVGIDIMGDYLIEVNVTSPTCLQEMNTFYEKQLEKDVIASLT